MSKKQTIAPIVLQIQPDQVQLLTIPEAAARLKVHRRTIYRYIKYAGLPTVKVGNGHIRIALLSLHRWIEQHEEAS